MSIVDEIIVGGWMTASGLIGFYAMRESGKLLRIRKRIALWLDDADTVRPTEESLLIGNEDAA
jgi:hypothetical protein